MAVSVPAVFQQLICRNDDVLSNFYYTCQPPSGKVTVGFCIAKSACLKLQSLDHWIGANFSINGRCV